MPHGVVSQIPSPALRCSASSPCDRCRSDRNFLRGPDRPADSAGDIKIAIVDLFAGCGGMTLGLYEASRQHDCRLKISLAMDSDQNALDIYQSNFPTASSRLSDVAEVFDGPVGSPPTAAESKIIEELGETDILVGGPPCQGHSDLNNHTRRDDPKNALYLRMARAAEILCPKVIAIENVATVHLDKNGVVQATSRALEACGYSVATHVLDLCRIGVPQRRRRLLLIATIMKELDPLTILSNLENAMPDHPDRTVRWAIEDLGSIHGNTAYDTPSKATEKNAKRIDLLFDRNLYDLPNRFRPECHRDKNHSYISMYGRLRWASPAQTITTGFGSMGQGRYVHPKCRRTITPHEAARLQTFPDWFKFGDAHRGVLASVIGNAVPPLLMREIGAAILPAIVKAREAHPENVRRRA